MTVFKDTDAEWNAIWKKRGEDYHQASIQFPRAHEKEFELFLKNTPFEKGATILEIAAAGGYCLVRAHEQWGSEIELLAVEPAEEFARHLPPYVRRIEGSTLTNFKLEDASVDMTINLSGLHHVEDNQAYINECFRVLKSGGLFGLGEVRKGSQVDQWLNGFLNEHNSSGHKGFFFEEGEISGKLAKAGFAHIREKNVPYTWNFDSTQDMIKFCKMLFGIDRTGDDEIKSALQVILGYEETSSGTALNWELIHAFAEKP